MSTAVECPEVREAAAILDKVEPGWWERVTLGKVDLHTANNCIIGQIYGSFEAGCARLGMTPFVIRSPWHNAFYPTEQPGFPEPRLDAWRSEIESRRQAHHAPTLEAEPLETPQREQVRDILTTAARIGAVTLSVIGLAWLGGLLN